MKQIHPASSRPLAWPFLGAPYLDAASNLFTAWMQENGRIQKEWLRFFSQRLEKTATWSVQCAECASPDSWLDLQVNRWTSLATDYLDETQAMSSLLREAAERCWEQLDKAFAPVDAHQRATPPGR